jgi:hypothetical protein
MKSANSEVHGLQPNFWVQKLIFPAVTTISDIRSVLPGSIRRGRPSAEGSSSHCQSREPSQWRRFVFVQVSVTHILLCLRHAQICQSGRQEVSTVLTISQCVTDIHSSESLHMLTLSQDASLLRCDAVSLCVSRLVTRHHCVSRLVTRCPGVCRHL